MVFTNFEAKEINCKVVYFGPHGAGKTTNLRALYKQTSTDLQSKMIDFESEHSSHRFFSFLPISLGHFKEFHIKMHLFVLPFNESYETVPDVMLKGIDGYVFVADSLIERMMDNIQSFQRVKRLLSERGYSPLEMPAVFQYNKRDLAGIVPIDIMKRELNLAQGINIEAIASQGIGTLETLQAMAKLVVKRLAP